MDLFSILILFTSAFLGGIAVFILKKDNTKNLKLLLSFSGAYLFGITALHLIPSVYSSGNEYIGLFVLAGFAFQIVLEQFSGGIEHGHIHHHGHEKNFPVAIMISLCLHAFLEAMPLANDANHHHLMWGIALHHIPAAFALTSILLQRGTITKNVFILLSIFAIMSPLGYWISQLLSENAIGNFASYFDYIIAIVIGIFLHISTTILFESSVDHQFNRKKTIAILIGVGIAIAGFFVGHG